MANTNRPRNEYWASISEWATRVPGEVVGIVGILASLGMFVWGMISLITKVRHVEPPLSWWDIGLTIGGAFLFIIISFWAFHKVRLERDQARKEKSQQETNKVRDEKLRVRQVYANRIDIPQMLLEMDSYLTKQMDMQKISLKDIRLAMKRARWSFLTRFPLFLLYLSPITRRFFHKAPVNAVIGFSESLNAILKDYGVGTLVITSKEGYKELYDKIVEREIGLPPITASKINQAIALSNTLNCLRIFSPNRSYWKSIKSRKPNALVVSLYSLSLLLNNVMSTLRSQISFDIEKFLIGE
jgi:hypothetical protein